MLIIYCQEMAAGLGPHELGRWEAVTRHDEKCFMAGLARTHLEARGLSHISYGIRQDPEDPSRRQYFAKLLDQAGKCGMELYGVWREGGPKPLEASRETSDGGIRDSENVLGRGDGD